jgi:hypothetical protein
VQLHSAGQVQQPENQDRNTYGRQENPAETLVNELDRKQAVNQDGQYRHDASRRETAGQMFKQKIRTATETNVPYFTLKRTKHLNLLSITLQITEYLHYYYNRVRAGVKSFFCQKKRDFEA